MNVKSIVGWIMVIIQAAFPVWINMYVALLYSTAAQADAAFDAQYNQLLQSGSMGAANEVYNYNLPELNTESTHSLAEEEYYTDDTQRYLKAEVHAKDTIENFNTGAGYSMSDLNEQMSINAQYQSDPESINNLIVNENHRDIAIVDCSGLSGSALIQCNQRNTRSELLESLQGRPNFDGFVDDVLGNSQDIMDGTSIFTQEFLSNDACSTITNDGVDGEPIYITRQETCTRQYELPTQECPIARDIETSYRVIRTLFEIDTLADVDDSPVNFVSCGSGCNKVWLGTVGDNYLSGNCTIFEEDIPLKIVQPNAITSVLIDYAKWDDWMQIYVGNSKVWSGPHYSRSHFVDEERTQVRFPPETSGACELSTSWSKNPNVRIEDHFLNANPGDILTIKNRVSVAGNGEAYARAIINWTPSQVTWQHCRANTGDLKPFRRLCGDFIRDIATPDMCEWALSGAGGTSIKDKALGLGCTNYFNQINNTLDAGHKLSNQEPSGSNTNHVPDPVAVGNTTEGARKYINAKFMNSCIHMLDKQNVPSSTSAQFKQIYDNLGLDSRAADISAAYNAAQGRTLLECPPISSAITGAPADLTGEHIIEMPVMKSDPWTSATTAESMFGINTKVTRRHFRNNYYQPGRHVPWYLDVHTDGFYEYEILDWGNPGNNWTIKLKLKLEYASYVRVNIALHEVVKSSFRPAEDCQICPAVNAHVGGDNLTIQGALVKTNTTCHGSHCNPTQNTGYNRCYYGFDPGANDCPSGWVKNPNGFCGMHTTSGCSYPNRSDEFFRQKCNVGFEQFLDNKLDATLRCVEEVDAFETLGGVIFDNKHPGFSFMLPSWQLTLGTTPVSNDCYKAILEIDPNNDVIDPYECDTLAGKEKQDCLDGKVCFPGVIPEDEVCYPLDFNLDIPGSPLLPTHPECGEYVSNPDCTINEEETRCIDWVTDASMDGEITCVAEEVVFDCLEQTGTMPGTGDSTSLVCNNDIKCMGEECVSIVEESNNNFGEAATALKMMNEMRSNMNCVDQEDPMTCRIFSGEISRCRDYRIFGAPDCCSKSDTGVPSGGWVAKARLTASIFEFASHEYTQKMMFNSWTGIESIADIPGGSWVDGTYSAIVEGVNTYLYQPVISGWNSMATSVGADWAQISQVTQEAAVRSGAAAGGASAGTESIFGDGLAQYAAQGVYDATSYFSPELANDIFAANSEGVVQGFGNEMVNSIASQLGTVLTVIGWIYLAYQIYNLLINLLYACDEQDVMTVQKNETLNCERLFKTCTSKFFWGSCKTYTTKYCCFDSPFARVFYKQAAIQFGEREGKDWKTYMQDHSCRGFLLTDIETIDFDRMDFTEFTNLLMTPGILAYDPNAMPDDYKPQGKWADGGANTGPGMNELNADAINPGLEFMDESHQSNRTDIVVNEAESMLWYDNNVSSSSACYYDCNVNGKTGFYDSQNGVCQEVIDQTTTPSYSCSEPASTLNGNRCEKEVTGPTFPRCAPDFVERYEQNLYYPYDWRLNCVYSEVVRQEPEASCPSGFTTNFLENQCEGYSTVPKEKTCSSLGTGFSIVDDKCIKNEVDLQPLNYECPAMYSPSGDNSECELITTDSPSSGNTCDNGVYNASTGLCDVRYTKPISKYCPSSDYTHDGSGYCVKTTVLEFYVQLTCPAGYDEMDSVTCKRLDQIEPLSYTCSHLGYGWAYENGDCVRETTTSHNPGEYCQNELLTYNPATGDCRKTYDTPAEASCPSDYVLGGNTCVKRYGGTYTGTYVCP